MAIKIIIIIIIIVIIIIIMYDKLTLMIKVMYILLSQVPLLIEDLISSPLTHNK